MKRKIEINVGWIMRTVTMTFTLAVIFSIVSEALIRHVNLWVALLLLLTIIFIGIFFDAIGIAVAAANDKPFHAMAAAKIPRAKYSLMLINNATKVSNFCNDVIGDIAGIVSGTTIGIIMGFFTAYGLDSKYFAAVTIGFSGVVAALTVGGKAIGKEIALKRSKEVLDATGFFIYSVKSVFSLQTYKHLFHRKE